ncbi:hypothetical protein FHS61_000162 [Altererythrobacter atlanticus]|uniref:Uncharacterized protein n=1 Tax=Croceibacterium atlanticum TaxID=1267766 RepID=A0A0F7KT50_9SPHN|nr:hypothetical protein [Croceibacterium atlanticum]AKH42392.1 hypothetical protein WYH_01351 [Croceibacterium atlanticum]MBB5731169.1 hypothetical protein [Croceibacterium atlanticum]
MTPQSRIRRVGWIAVLTICTALYVLLLLKVNAVHSEVVRAERQIVSLEQQKNMLETEFETRANQLQLAAWNRVDFGYTAPTAGQFVENERQLASLGSPRSADAPAPIRVAGTAAQDGTPDFPKLVSPLTGKPMSEALLEPEKVKARGGDLSGGPMRIQLGAVIRSDVP